MIVNLHSKLASFAQNDRSRRGYIGLLLNLVETAVDLIYFEPRGLSIRAQLQPLKLEVTPPPSLPDAVTPTAESFVSAAAAGLPSLNQDVSMASSYGVGEHDLDEGGLTIPEYQILLDDIRSGRLSGSEKTRAMSQLLFGARGT